MATLETVQFHGVGDVGANVVDRFYGRASTAPALVFGQLLKLAQSHLGSMNEKPGVRTALEKELQEILSQLDAGLPRTLDSEGQGLFALGYWHQRAFRFEEINRRRGERANDKGAADAVVSQL
jgi:CRISPR-associated protein Csd1